MTDIDIDIAVVGAGIAGLSAAYRLHEAGREVRVFESAGRVGGRMASERRQGCLLDMGAESIAARGYDATWALIDAVGIPRAEVEPIPGSLAVWRGGRAHPYFGRPAGLVTGAGMSWRGRLSWLRFAAGLAARSRSIDPDRPESTPFGAQTIAEYARGRHHDLLDYLLQPLAGHCFGWRPERSTLGPMVANLLAVGGAGAQWMTYRDGMDTLARALADRLDVSTESPVARVSQNERSVRVELAGGGALTARRVVLAIPAPRALCVHNEAPADELPYLQASSYSPMLKMMCLLDSPLGVAARSRVYAMSVPAVESRTLAGFIFDHLKSPGRAPQSRGLVSVFASPWGSAELMDRPDGEVVSGLCGEAERFLPGLRAATLDTVVHRHRLGLPEAGPDAVRTRRAFLERPVRRIEYAGDWLMLRPSSEGAIRSGELAARRILSANAARRP